jgi:TPR repeat protein
MKKYIFLISILILSCCQITLLADTVSKVSYENSMEFKAIYKRAVDGIAEYQIQLADMYYRGKVIEQDYKKAFEWYQKAADQGLGQAHIFLGIMYYKEPA